MVRRSVFWGLTGMLVVVIAYLVWQGRRQEKAQRQNPKPAEIVKVSSPSSTRILAPADLEIVGLETTFDGEGPRVARHKVTLRNKGGSTFKAVLIRLQYFDKRNKPFETRNQLVPGILQPGRDSVSEEWVVENLPAHAVRSAGTILAGDLQ